MKASSQVASNKEVRLEKDMYFDAWLYNFMIENNFAYHMNKDIVASPEQMAFMVALEEDEVYIPCSEKHFQLLTQPHLTKELRKQYARVWLTLVKMLRGFEPQRAVRRRVLAFCRYRFRQFIKNHTVLPSRAMKRITSLMVAHTGVDDPWHALRQEANAKEHDIFTSSALQAALYKAPQDFTCYQNLAHLRAAVNSIEISRLMYLSADARHLSKETPSPLEWQHIFENLKVLHEPLMTLLGNEEDEPKTILFLPDTSGGFVFDMALLSRLQRMGHKIIVSMKKGFYFYSPTLQDTESDPILEELLEGAAIVREHSISKNHLLNLLREHSLVVIHDGTRERLNLYRTNVVFARAWKEADVILAKGWRNAEILALSSQKFTRDIVCYWTDTQGTYTVKEKPRARHIRKLSEADIRERAEGIIAEMRRAQKAGKTVMFYSCIIGSIPGQESTAIALVRAFVENLRQKLDDIYIVNPAEQSPDGMDGDDLMYMWERVQRSGYIHVWRFQTVQDIEDSFALLGRKVLPAWAGKDATFSTGCTKEMRIALDVQRRNTELQIIGPDKEKFFRRNNYGVGKYFDARI